MQRSGVWHRFTIASLAGKGELSRTVKSIGGFAMSRRLFAALLGFGLAVSLIPQVLRAEEDHITEAILHTKQALIHGRNGHADLVSEHAKVALSHARAADIAKGNPHTSEAVKELEQTIDESKMNHAVMATGHAEAALTHLEQAK
jgi:Small metal-binding protein